MNINPAQMMWYAFMFNQDKETDFDSKLNMTEYLASYINYEAVRQTKEARDTKKEMSDEDFEQLVRDQFGRDFSADLVAKGTRADVEEQPEAKQKVKKKGDISASDLKRYLGVELDEVRFVPNKK